MIVVLSKEALLELARDRATKRFAFLDPVRMLLVPMPMAACPTCPKKIKPPTFDDALYRAVLLSAAFSAEETSLKDFLQADQLLIPASVRRG